jgi:hypothetical protein
VPPWTVVVVLGLFKKGLWAKPLAQDVALSALSSEASWMPSAHRKSDRELIE